MLSYGNNSSGFCMVLGSKLTQDVPNQRQVNVRGTRVGGAGGLGVDRMKAIACSCAFVIGLLVSGEHAKAEERKDSDSVVLAVSECYIRTTAEMRADHSKYFRRLGGKPIGPTVPAEKKSLFPKAKSLHPSRSQSRRRHPCR